MTDPTTESTFRVSWETDIFDATTPHEAARKALEMHRNPESTATVFTVTSPDGTKERIDLLDDDEPCGESGCICHCGAGHVCACDCPRCWDCGQRSENCQCDDEEA